MQLVEDVRDVARDLVGTRRLAVEARGIEGRTRLAATDIAVGVRAAR
jgi:hypothetical protein